MYKLPTFPIKRAIIFRTNFMLPRDKPPPPIVKFYVSPIVPPFCHDLAWHHALLIFCTNALLFFKMLTNKCAHCQWSPFPNGGSELDMLHRHIELLNDRIATEQKQTFFHLWCWLDADALDSGDAHLWAHLCKGCKHRFRLLCSNTKRWC